MKIISQVFAAAGDTTISDLYNPAPLINNSPTFKLTDIFTSGGFNLFNLVFYLVGLFFFINLIATGWDYMMSSGDPKKVATASSRFTNGFIGLILTIAAFIIVRIVTQLLGLSVI